MAQTLQAQLPLPHRLREYVLLPRRESCYCIFHKCSSTGPATAAAASYVLFYEFLGASLPLLFATRSRSVRQEFTFYDPSLTQFHDNDPLFPLEEVEEDHKSCSLQCPWQRRFIQYRRLRNRSQGRNAIRLTNVFQASDTNIPTTTSSCDCLTVPMTTTANGSHGERRQVVPSRFVAGHSADNGNLADQNRWGTELCSRCNVASSTSIVQLLLNRDLPENIPLAKMRSNVTGSRFELLGCQVSLPRLLAHINFEERLKNCSGSGVGIRLTEVRPGSGWQMADYRRELCREMGGAPCSCGGGLSDSSTLAMGTCEDPANTGDNSLVPSAAPPLTTETTNSGSDTVHSCASTPSHWHRTRRHTGSALLPGGSGSGFSVIRSLPSTPRKPQHGNKIAKICSSNCDYMSTSSKVGKSDDQNVWMPSPPVMRSVTITKHQSVVTWREENVPLFKKTALFLDNEEVLSTGKLEADKYFLEFRYPFSPIQAFAFGISSINRMPK